MKSMLEFEGFRAELAPVTVFGLQAWQYSAAPVLYVGADEIRPRITYITQPSANLVETEFRRLHTEANSHPHYTGTVLVQYTELFESGDGSPTLPKRFWIPAVFLYSRVNRVVPPGEKLSVASPEICVYDGSTFARIYGARTW